jgi:histidinol phosphatase-like enzyme (inositol monophosphatase family)
MHNDELTIPIEQLTAFALELAAASARETLGRFRTAMDVETKASSDWDPVTEADRSAERVMRALIEARYPSHGILGEEFPAKPALDDFTWILDPVDGTRAFVIGMPTWATLIGLYHKNQPLLGVMDQPYVGDTYYGNPAGAWLCHNGKTTPLKIASASTLRNAKIGTTTPHRYHGEDEKNFRHLREKATLVRYGGDAYFFSLVAQGMLDVAMDPGLQVYDIAALIPIIKGAGGVVGTWDGTDPAAGGNIIAASSSELLNEVKATMTAKASMDHA